MQFLVTLLAFTAAFTSAASAKPLHIARSTVIDPVSDIVVTPSFIEPAGGESYATGSNQTAQWDTSDIPVEASNYTGVLYLGYGKDVDEHLDIGHPLAYGFKLTDGQVGYTIPANATARTTYFLILLGDSGNKSPYFSITN